MLLGQPASGAPKSRCDASLSPHQQHDHNDDDDQENDSATYVHVRPPLSSSAPDTRPPRGWTQIPSRMSGHAVPVGAVFGVLRCARAAGVSRAHRRPEHDRDRTRPIGLVSPAPEVPNQRGVCVRRLPSTDFGRLLADGEGAGRAGDPEGACGGQAQGTS